MYILLLIYNSEIIQISFKAVLGGKAGVHKEAFFAIPFFEAAVVEQLQVILDNEGDNIVLQTLLEEDQTAYTAVSVLEGMDAFKGHMKGYNVLKGFSGQCVIVCQQLAHLTGNIFGKRGVITAHLVGKLFVLAYSEPILAAVAGAGLQYEMQCFDNLLGQRRACLVDL